MGLVKNIFGTIFGLFGSILKAIGGVVGLGKKSEFYLEVDEAGTGSSPVTEEVPSAEQTATAVAKAEAPSPATPAATSPQAVAPAVSAPTQLTPVAQPATPKPAPVGNFATDYLTAPAAEMKRRRRPGPSLSSFREMASQLPAAKAR
jgi:hypothetical protein